ncbi:MAG TPA: sigma-70 family RNA polymerase sigma factor [Ferruginibacter sp.]|nr:sigma-70 family RNA polymerase sigma factor [Ferruginibacter sp.]
MTETDIIKGCIKKNQVCQRLLFEKFAGKMMSLCQRYAKDQQEAKDIMQEGFIRVFDYIAQFKFEGSFEGWMRRVFVSVATRYAAKRKIIFSEINVTDSDINTIDPSVVSKLSEDEIHRMIRLLPEGYRLVFNLNIIEGYSHEEIGSLLGIQASTSRTQLVKARRMLQSFILKQFNTVIV